MRRLLMDPAFPDIVGEWAELDTCSDSALAACANDNHEAEANALSDPLLALVAKAEIEATRLW